MQEISLPHPRLVSLACPHKVAVKTIKPIIDQKLFSSKLSDGGNS